MSNKTEPVDKPTKEISIMLREKRNELIWALAYQGYNGSQIGLIFNINRSTVLQALRKKPEDYKPKWIKAN